MAAGTLLTCLVIGALVELLSRALNLWVYRQAWLRAFSVVVVFGLVFGGLSSAVATQPLWVRFGAGAALGIAYEAANMLWLELFAFQEPLSRIRSRALLISIAGVPWGVLPAIAPTLARLVP